MDYLVDWVAILTVPVAFITWCIGNIIINNQYIKNLNIIYERDLNGTKRTLGSSRYKR